MPACPAVGFADQLAAVNTTRSLLCVYHEGFAGDWNKASSDCYTYYGGAHLCRHEEVRRACLAGGFTPIINSWIAERIDDDDAMYVNIADCGNFDGQDPVGNSKAGKYCCSEWPKY